MLRHHPNHHFGDGDVFGPDNDGLPGINVDSLGLGRSPHGFIGLVDAILARPGNPVAAAGRNGATDDTSKLFWVYRPDGALLVKALPGFLSTQTGDGGFSMIVRPDGSWRLAFDGSDKVIGHEAGDPAPTPPPPSPDLPLIPYSTTFKSTGPNGFDASALPPSLINGGAGWDTFQGGAGDYMIGGTGTAGGGLAGNGNCAVYTSSPGSILADMENGAGYGSNADGNIYVNMNQVRGSFQSNVLIGNTNGTDLKSGGANSLLISTGGIGFELRPDAGGNVLVSTAGGDRVVFDPNHGWLLGDDNIMLGFNPAHGCSLDLTVLTNGKPIKALSGPAIASDFHSITAAGYDPATGTGDINDYVKIVDAADGSHVYFSATGQVQTSGTQLIDLEFTHGLNVSALYASHQILA